ncbi:MAG: mechanosensitive ion channel family protein [Phycisphaerae bacterium]
MLESFSVLLLGEISLWDKTINYQILTGNPLWRLVMLLIVLVITITAGRMIQFFIDNYIICLIQRRGENLLSLTLKCLNKPISVAVFAVGFHMSRLCLVFDNPQTEAIEGLSATINQGWTQIAKAVAAIAVAYAMFRLVDIVEYYLLRWTGKTQTKLDDMLVPVVRKSLRITIAIITAMFIVDNILHQDVKSILLGAGVGGIAIAMAAKETIANFFGSLTIFADKPFQIDDMVKIADFTGPIEEVGFRSTRIRTLNGHLVTIPNSTVANSTIENISRRPFIRRISNITITYDSGYNKTKRAIEIIKDILANTPEVNLEEGRPPRVYFTEFNDTSLNIYMSYWVKPADIWVYNEVNERVNMEILKRFDSEGIEFAFPTQTLYLKKDQ